MRRTMSIGLVAGIVGLTGPYIGAQECEVGGLICEDTTWSVENCPPDGVYIVTNSIMIGCGATLTIEPDVEVRFQHGLAMTIGSTTFGAGTLVARGTAESPILFTTNDPYEDLPDPADPGDWARVYFTDYAVNAFYDEETGEYLSGSILEYVIIEYGGDGVSTVTVEKCSPYITHCEIRHNAHRGIYVNGTDAPPILIEDCEIWDNSESDSGLGICLTAGFDHILKGNNVHDCTANGNSRYGGGIYVNARTTLEGNTVRGNSTTGGSSYGGGVYLGPNSDGSTLSGNEVTGNSTSGYSAHGGGICLSSSTGCTLTGNTISDNTVTYQNASIGGIYLSYSGSTTFEYNTIAGNQAIGSDSHTGGLFLASSGSCTLTENTITDNTATWEGGALYFSGSANCTVTGNCITANHTIDGTTGGIFITGNSQGISFAGDPDCETPNVIASNDGCQIKNDMPFQADGSNDIDARYVNWCTDDTDAIQDGICDYFDDPSRAIVVWFPFCEPIPIPGDLDGDWDVDHSDLGVFLSAWCSHEGDPNWNPDADFDADGHVGHGDLGILLAHWGEACAECP